MNFAIATSRNESLARRMPAVVALAAALLVAPVTASAATVFDIAGVGCVSDIVLKADGTAGSGCFGAIDQGYRMTGTVTIDVHGAPDGFSADPVGAAGNNWVRTSFRFQWTGPSSGGYDGELSGATSVENSAAVYNDIVSGGIGYGQQLFSASGKVLDDGPNHASTYASLMRITDRTNETWLSDLRFVETAGLAPGPGATNWIDFMTFGTTTDPATGQILSVLPGSRQGTFIVTSMTISAVPEPGTGALALGGLAILGLVLRRRSGRST